MNLRLLIPATLTCVVCAVSGLDPVTAQRRGAEQPVPCDSTWITVLLVRHADRAGKADSLSAAGLERARELEHVAGAAGVTAIYSSDTRRTRDTAAPLAATLEIQPEIYPAKDVTTLMRMIRTHAGETVLVVGHSNTVPLIIAAAGGPSLPDLAEDTYDDLFVLHVDPCGLGRTSVTHLQYGASSP